MKIASIILASIALIATFYFVSLKIKTYNFHKTEQKKFIENIKSGRKSYDAANWMSPFSVQENDKARLMKDTVIDVSNGKVYALSSLLDTTSLFLNYWFTSCKGCDTEMPEIEQFYEKYKNDVKFLILSNDSLSTVRNYLAKNHFTLPIYVFKNGRFPADLEVFPASHLVINKKTAFYYAGIGYFDNNDFYQFVDSALAK
jgi:thiol-disulfide isomerase/thioredoxin